MKIKSSYTLISSMSPNNSSAGPPSNQGKLRIGTKIYNGLVGTVDPFVPYKLQPLWNHPAGPKTIFFWAPLFKWGMVLAGLSDLKRTPDTLSIYQCSSLAVTGFIWARYSTIIVPKNWSLFYVNLFLSLTQCVQLFRAVNYRLSQNEK